MKNVKIIVTVFGALVLLAGGVFFLQGMNVITVRSFMRNDPHWVVYGGLMVVVGAILIVAANWARLRRKK